MMAGELWLSPTHNFTLWLEGELNLTPSSETTLAADAEGKIVCIQPENAKWVTFLLGPREGLPVPSV